MRSQTTRCRRLPACPSRTGAAALQRGASRLRLTTRPRLFVCISRRACSVSCQLTDANTARVPVAASGSGGVSRQTLGTVVIGGMLGATLVDTFIVPVTFSIVERVVARVSKKARAEHKPKPPEPNG